MSEIKKQFEKERDEFADEAYRKCSNGNKSPANVYDMFEAGFTEGALNSSVTKMLEDTVVAALKFHQEMAELISKHEYETQDTSECDMGNVMRNAKCTSMRPSIISQN